jgi:hypothetical protein
VPKLVETSDEGKAAILWNQQVQTDRTIPKNKPDVIIRDNGRGMCMLIDVATGYAYVMLAVVYVGLGCFTFVFVVLVLAEVGLG